MPYAPPGHNAERVERNCAYKKWGGVLMATISRLSVSLNANTRNSNLLEIIAEQLRENTGAVAG